MPASEYIHSYQVYIVSIDKEIAKLPEWWGKKETDKYIACHNNISKYYIIHVNTNAKKETDNINLFFTA